MRIAKFYSPVWHPFEFPIGRKFFPECLDVYVYTCVRVCVCLSDGTPVHSFDSAIQFTPTKRKVRRAGLCVIRFHNSVIVEALCFHPIP